MLDSAQPHPGLGVLLHAIGGLAAASFYIPYKAVHGWAWENFWIVGGIFSWLIAPWLFALILVPHTLEVLRQTPPITLFWTFLFGVLWGVGGLTFGLSMRYLGIALGYAVALGLCAVCGTLIPPLYAGTFAAFAATHGGQVVLAGIVICLLGIAASAWAGASKQREQPPDIQRQSVAEFRFGRGLFVACICGITSAAFAFGLAAAKPMAHLALQLGTPPLWQNLPIFIVVMLGGLITNAIWCGALIANNHSAAAFASPSAPLARNFLLCALAGMTWYLQFFFYGMGTTQMGRYDFSSWTLHMASIILFGTVWGIALLEWKGTSRATHLRIATGLALLIASMVLVGYGNHLAGS